ncbi:hypothetical protein LRS13_14775 [Svornostia abyssi]|uniref:Uncharacterized protein n=1 Tax=Svornostia abyssi TaxID=2898438 RepID=A0ABY5PBC6_9ACTN|nr:hypothetical protein LRS13_14775 [Parviterribacteraceae bacterium J379]
MNAETPERGMKVTMMLCDYVAAPDGKLTIVGGGWSVTGPQPVPFGIAVTFEVPWNLTNQRHAFRFELIDPDGNGVVPLGGSEPVIIEGDFEVGRPPGARVGTSFPFPLPINSGPMPLAPGGHYEWRLFVNGQTHEDWRLAFSTRPDAQSNAA